MHSLEGLDLPIDVLRALWGVGIVTVEYLKYIPAEDMKRIPGLGPASRRQIRSALKRWDAQRAGDAQHKARRKAPRKPRSEGPVRATRPTSTAVPAPSRVPRPAPRSLIDEWSLPKARFSEDRPLDTLGLSGQVCRTLRDRGILTVADLANLNLRALDAMGLLEASTLYAIRAALVDYSRLDRRPWPIASRRKILARRGLLSALPRAELERAPLSKLALGNAEIERLAKAGIVAVAQVALLPKGAYGKSMPHLPGALTAYLRELAIEVKTARPRSRAARVAVPPSSRSRTAAVQQCSNGTERLGSLAQLVAAWLPTLHARTRAAVCKAYGLPGVHGTAPAEADRLDGVDSRGYAMPTKARVRLCRLGEGVPIAGHVRAAREFLFQKGGLASEQEVRDELARYLDLGGLDPVAACRIVADVSEELRWLGRQRLLGDTSRPLHMVTAIRRSVRGSVSQAGKPVTLTQALGLFWITRAYRECGEPDEAFVLACLRTDPQAEIGDGSICWGGGNRTRA